MGWAQEVCIIHIEACKRQPASNIAWQGALEEAL